MNTYIWKYQFGEYEHFKAIYFSDVDKGQEGEWKLTEMFPVWCLTERHTKIFDTEQALLDFVDNSYKEYQIKNRQESFGYLFNGIL